MTRIESDPIKFLEQSYCERRAKNPSYSLRAFAKFLDISPARLSQVMTGVRPITKGQIEKIAIATSLSPSQSASLFAGIAKKAKPVSSQQRSTDSFQELSESVYKVLSDVDASSVLAALPLCKSTASQQIKLLSKKFGISTIQVRRTLDSLVSSKLVKKENDVFCPTHASVASTSDVKSSALRKYHKAILNRAIESIEEQNIEERDLSSITLIMDPVKMEMAKEKIKNFRRDLSELLESSGKPSEVYALNIQLFKLSK